MPQRRCPVTPFVPIGFPYVKKQLPARRALSDNRSVYRPIDTCALTGSVVLLLRILRVGE